MTMNYKKMLCFVLILVLTFSLVACGAGDPAETTVPVESTAVTEPDTALQEKPETDAAEATEESATATEATQIPDEDNSGTEPQTPDSGNSSTVTNGNTSNNGSTSNNNNTSGNNGSTTNTEKPNAGNTGAGNQPSATEPPKEDESKPNNGSNNKPAETEPPKVEETKPNSGNTNKPAETEPPKEGEKHTHSYTVSSSKDATCTANGSKTYKCSCGDSYTETVKATGHSWSAWKTTKEPTTSAEGQKSRSCKNCSQTETQSIPKKESGNPAETEPPATEHTHSYKVVSTKKATCTEAGSKTYKCSCGDSYTETTDAAKGHNWSSWDTTKQPTTTSEGEMTRNCMTCFLGESKTVPKLQPGETTPSDEHIHNYGEVSREDATCTETGVATYRCSCGDEYTAPLAALGHGWECVYHPEVGHYGEYYCVCACGASFSNEDAWFSHVMSSPEGDRVLYHASWGTARDWIVDSPEYYDWQCWRCGAVSATQP